MPTKYQRHSLRATTYTEKDLEEAVEKVKNKELSNYAASKMYGIPTSTLNDRVLRKTGIKSQTLGRAPAIPLEQETKLADCLRTLEKWGWGLSKEEVLDIVAAFVRKNNLPTPFKNNRPGTKWFVSFRERHRLSVKKPQAVEVLRKRMTDPFVIDEYFTLLKEVLSEFNINDPRRIWNLDETSVSLDPTKTKVVGAVGQPCTRTTAGTGKENVTVLTTVNAAGDKLNPLIVFKGKNVYDEWMLEDRGTYDFELAYAASKRGWMETDIFFNYMANHVIPGLGSERPQLMVYDGHVTHVDERVVGLAAENGLIILKLPAHTSHLLQPLDIAVFKSFKATWDRQLVTWQRENIGVKVRKQAFAGMFAEAWQNTKPNIIENGFKKGGIHPYNPTVIPKAKFDPGSFKRWQKHKYQNTVSKETCKTLAQLCIDFINKAIHSNSSILHGDDDNGHPEQAKLDKTICFEDLLLDKIKQQPQRNKTATKLTRVASGAEVITRSYLEKKKKNEQQKSLDNMHVENEKPGSSGIGTQKTTKKRTEGKRKGNGKKTTTGKNNLRLTGKAEQDISIFDSTVQDKAIEEKSTHMEIPETSRIRPQKEKSTLKTAKGKGIGKKSKTKNTNTCLTDHLDQDISISINTKQIELTKTIKKAKYSSNYDNTAQNKLTKSIKRENDTNNTITSKKNPAKKIKRSVSIASTPESIEISLHSDSDIENSLSDIFPEMDAPTNFHKEIEDLTREEEITRIIKEIYEEDDKIEENDESKKDDKLHTNEKENIETYQMAKDENEENIDSTLFAGLSPLSTLDGTLKKKVSIISTIPITKNNYPVVKYNSKGLKIIDFNSNLHLQSKQESSTAGVRGKNVENFPKYNTGETVLVRYFTRSWKYFVGLIKEVHLKEKKYTVSFYKTFGKNQNVIFVVPKRKDVDCVPEDSIVKLIELLQMTENPPQFTLMDDEDASYF